MKRNEEHIETTIHGCGNGRISRHYNGNHVGMIVNGDCLEELDKLDENSIDAIVTDPPYLLGFMGKEWDKGDISSDKNTWEKCLRVLKPGGYLLSFGGTRTYHRIACAIEDAGFEIRDCIQWIYGSGFAKSLNALKPSWEPIVMARKPFKGSLADNVMKYGVGGLNIDECRVWNGEPIAKLGEEKNVGRFPANTILTYDENDYEEVCGGFPYSKGGSGKGFKKGDYGFGETATSFGRGDFKPYNDSGSAARYFYCARASRKDRDEGLPEGEQSTHPTVKPTALMQYLIRLVSPKGATILDPFMGSGSTGKAVMYENKERNANYKFIGIEKDAEYCRIAEARIKNAESNK